MYSRCSNWSLSGNYLFEKFRSSFRSVGRNVTEDEASIDPDEGTEDIQEDSDIKVINGVAFKKLR